jgi:hypothetical protein
LGGKAGGRDAVRYRRWVRPCTAATGVAEIVPDNFGDAGALHVVTPARFAAGVEYRMAV